MDRSGISSEALLMLINKLLWSSGIPIGTQVASLYKHADFRKIDKTLIMKFYVWVHFMCSTWVLCNYFTCLSLPMFNALVIPIFGCMMMVDMRRKAKIIYEEISGKRYFSSGILFGTHYNFMCMLKKSFSLTILNLISPGIHPICLLFILFACASRPASGAKGWGEQLCDRPELSRAEKDPEASSTWTSRFWDKHNFQAGNFNEFVKEDIIAIMTSGIHCLCYNLYLLT